MNNFDYKSYLKNNYLLQEELKDNGPEEKAFDNEFDALGSQLAGAIKNELGDKAKKLDEVAGIVGIIGYILLSNTVANMLAKFVQKISKKYNWGKGEEAAKNIYKWTHDNEKAFQAPIGRVISLFTKDPKKIDEQRNIRFENSERTFLGAKKHPPRYTFRALNITLLILENKKPVIGYLM